MWCDNCDYMPEEYEEKYMICPNCNTYIERNLPESPVKIQLVYNKAKVGAQIAYQYSKISL